MAGEPNQPEHETPEVEISPVNPAASVVRTSAPPSPPTPRAAAVEVLPAENRGSRLPDIESHVSEFTADVPGSLSPFGDEVEFPLPFERLSYRHPGPANRPALAQD